jgi:hypothetical protein
MLLGLPLAFSTVDAGGGKERSVVPAGRYGAITSAHACVAEVFFSTGGGEDVPCARMGSTVRIACSPA